MKNKNREKFLDLYMNGTTSQLDKFMKILTKKEITEIILYQKEMLVRGFK